MRRKWKSSRRKYGLEGSYRSRNGYENRRETQRHRISENNGFKISNYIMKKKRQTAYEKRENQTAAGETAAAAAAAKKTGENGAARSVAASAALQSGEEKPAGI